MNTMLVQKIKPTDGVVSALKNKINTILVQKIKPTDGVVSAFKMMRVFI